MACVHGNDEYLFRCPGSKGIGNSQALAHVPLPEGYTELTPGPNPDYHADKIFMEASSPVKPPQQFVLDLTHLARLEPSTPGMFTAL
jgi:hypothetical protein